MRKATEAGAAPFFPHQEPLATSENEETQPDAGTASPRNHLGPGLAKPTRQALSLYSAHHDWMRKLAGLPQSPSQRRCRAEPSTARCQLGNTQLFKSHSYPKEERIHFLQKGEVGQAGQPRDLVLKEEISEQSPHISQRSEIPHPRKTLEGWDRNPGESGLRPEPWTEAGANIPLRSLS